MEIYEQGSASNKYTLQNHVTKTFFWMFLGLGITFGIAILMNLNPAFVYNLWNSIPMLPIIVVLAQLGVVIALAARLMKMNPTSAKILYIAYAVLTGFTFSTLGVVYSLGSIGLAFGMAALFFGSLVVIGYTTKRDLTKVGTIAIAGLLALIVYGMITWIFNLDVNVFIYSMIGLLIFAGLTAWDTQKMKKLYHAYENDDTMLQRLSIYSAFDLYLDFINIFLYILRIVGNNRN
ncbi:FtsH-binding integral membrane protein [Breznakia sp. PF5-3]|uniref:Bax inhibitor-1/YccA family protein n=1 Tax=unclassified Breznakia TaxID=2623764 RepID=UPI00240549B4|nr:MULTISPECIES: Bax inhibitor-1/YccA family protein [unclassified Breznakia]MDF9824962.1 FtsH-binding integral membrane protein [Breznakia sp. PM6-1]MDF9835845.1 FtsH-binding integral membrane protein [Breznakia sp. PF5-3]MDF9836903.1 FtsH-binding integral membrane protein [Breznakia sp. PFB2-8]MDF9859849.1 FtsH-binding integral membrane protein [Breznakia sp. PH5-24]